VEATTFDLKDYESELNDAETNREVGTRLLLENDRVRIWDLDLAPGERVPFHCHATPYFFVCVDEGRGLSRFPDGNAMTIDYREGDTWFDEVQHGSEVHDLENVGDTRLRFTTVELLG
jgi:quercetin dioxygenase-like cupin family protein